ncbi:MAG TPA: hypothetical protein VJT54_07420 [Verrucomicrobiae bacterium]|nr:hypothetical protein [Verrucomicrobiae bacterium]
MDSRPISLRWSLFFALAALVMVSFVEAQPAATNAWKPIIFSAPAQNDISSNPISPSTQPVAPADLRGLFQGATPLSSFNNFAPAAPNAGRRIPKTAEDSQDWIFMTPAEIMGVSSDQILQSGKNNEHGRQVGLTPMERYLERRDPSARFNLSGNPSRSRNFGEAGNDQTNSDFSSYDLIHSSPDDLRATTDPGPFVNTTPNNYLFANPNEDSTWSKVFGAPARQAPSSSSDRAQQQAHQQAEMDQFQQLLNPGSVPITAATAVSDNSSAFRAQYIPPITDSTQPLVNPIGASFAPLNGGIGQPAALTPLPGITRPAGIPAVTAPAWAPQPAPWMSQNPQPFAVPQRKF